MFFLLILKIDDNKKSWYYDRIPKTTTSGKILSKSRREAFNSRTIGIACYRNLNRDQESLLFSRIQEGKALSYDGKFFFYYFLYCYLYRKRFN